VLSLPWRAETSNSRSRRKTSVLRPMISARTARIDDNLGRGTDSSNPLPSSGESGANLISGGHAGALDVSSSTKRAAIADVGTRQLSFRPNRRYRSSFGGRAQSRIKSDYGRVFRLNIKFSSSMAPNLPERLREIIFALAAPRWRANFLQPHCTMIRRAQDVDRGGAAGGPVQRVTT
jgi:hypothetical protein